jgi:hypothetical protein
VEAKLKLYFSDSVNDSVNSSLEQLRKYLFTELEELIQERTQSVVSTVQRNTNEMLGQELASAKSHMISSAVAVLNENLSASQTESFKQLESRQNAVMLRAVDAVVTKCGTAVHDFEVAVAAQSKVAFDELTSEVCCTQFFCRTCESSCYYMKTQIMHLKKSATAESEAYKASQEQVEALHASSKSTTSEFNKFISSFKLCMENINRCWLFSNVLSETLDGPEVTKGNSVENIVSAEIRKVQPVEGDDEDMMEECWATLYAALIKMQANQLQQVQSNSTAATQLTNIMLCLHELVNFRLPKLEAEVGCTNPSASLSLLSEEEEGVVEATFGGLRKWRQQQSTAINVLSELGPESPQKFSSMLSTVENGPNTRNKQPLSPAQRPSSTSPGSPRSVKYSFECYYDCCFHNSVRAIEGSWRE